jgi:Carbohydrate binding domain
MDRRNALRRVAGPLAVSSRQLLPLLVSAGAIVMIAAVGTDRVPAPAAAVALAVACIASSPVIALAIVIVAANDLHLFHDSAIGPVTAVDLAIAATVARSAISAERRRPGLLESCALGFLLVGGVATVVARNHDATTAYGRCASYLVLGLVVGRALRPGDRLLLARSFVGAELGQAAAAVAGLTATMSTDFPIGRYLGTLGDPGQFGIPVAFAAVLVGVSPQIIRPRLARYAVAALLCVAVAGSVTRSAWSVLGMGYLIAAVAYLARARSRVFRAALGIAGLGIAGAATAVVIVGAGSLGLTEESSAIRQRSIEAAWAYLLRHPLRPTGLGTPSDLAQELETTDKLIFASSFESTNSGWSPYRDATLVRTRASSVFGSTALKVDTRGRTKNEGIELSTIGGLRSDSPYTVSLYLKGLKAASILLYINEYTTTEVWKTYTYTALRGTGQWKRYSWFWRTGPATGHIRLYLFTAGKFATSFLVDGLQLQAGSTLTRFAGKEKLPPRIVEVSAIYNTWLAVSIELGVIAAALLAILAIGAPYQAYRLGDRAGSFGLAALLVPSMTESFVYGASFVTLMWFTALGIAVTAGRSRRGGIQRTRDH